MFAFTPLLPPANAPDAPRPTRTSSLGQVHQSLLSFGGSTNILIDVGWNSDLSMDISYLVRMAPSIDVILLTHATVSHLGAYAYLCKAAPELAAVPVYATTPVITMGRMLTYDVYRSAGLLGPLPTAQLTLADVDTAFDRIHSLKYSQPLALFGKLQGFTITAQNAGHTLGGTVWRIQKDQEDIVYAVDWNHTRDGHLNGAFLQASGEIIESINRPSVMICGSQLSASVPLKRRRDALFQQVKDVVGRGGTVLIPSSSGARVLEVCSMLDSYWQANGISTPLIYYSHVGLRTMAYASSMLEWMSPNIIQQWESQASTPFETRRMKYLTDLNKIPDGPKVIVASGEAMENGFARSIFARFCEFESTTVILTETTGPGTLTGELMALWKEKQGASEGVVSLATKLHLNYFSEVPLEGEELARFNEAMRESQRKEELQTAIELRNRNILEKEESESSDDEEDELVLTGKMDLGILIYGSNVYDYDVRSLKGRNRMFPYFPRRRRVDDYGDAIREEDFTSIAEAEIDTERTSGRGSSRNGNSNNGRASVIGEKRSWAADEDEFTRSKGPGKDSEIASSFTKPVKIVPNTQELKILCSVSFIDFEGLTDERSLKMIIPRIQPSRLIMIPSVDGEDDSELVESIKQAGVQNVFYAVPNEPITAGISGIHTYEVKISPELASLLSWQKVLGDYSVAHVTGRLAIRVNEEESKQITLPAEEIKVEQDNSVSVIPTEAAQPQVIELEPLRTAKELAAAPRANPLLIGDIKLAELKKRLIAQGHKAEFRAEGILVCDDKVAVRKLAEGRLIIEGSTDKEFYQTRALVRSLLATV